jgi:hypothetical protein
MAYKFRTPGPWGAGTLEDLDPIDIDNNFWQAIQDINAKAAQGVGIANIFQTGNQLFFTLTDHTILGPFTLQGVQLRFAGEWQPSTAYFVGDIITYNGITYGVNVNHTSDTTFDPGLSIDAQDVYTKILDQPTLIIPTGGAIGTFLRKLSAADHDMGWLTTALGDLSDVIVDSPPPVTGQALVFSGGVWVPGSVATKLSDLSDVFLPDSPPPDIGQVLMWDGTQWTNDNTSFIPTITSPHAGQILIWNGTNWINSNTADLPIPSPVNANSTITLDYTAGSAQRIVMTGSTTLDHVANWPPTGRFGRLVLEITNTSAFTWTWPSSYRWPGGAAPGVSINGRDIYALTTFDGGTTVSGSTIGQNYL